MTYRREIDGLRALAVLAVILFHAGVAGLPGGYVGVDVFFVISGYLITAHVTAALAAGRFSPAEFYARRARRLLPALFLVLATCLPLAAWLLPPPDRREFAGSLMAVPVFAANVFFLAGTGYFNTDAGTKPLLHTWSLGVEEQFYLLFPWLLLGWRAHRRRVVRLGALVFVVSLGFAAGLAWLDAPAAFFLLPARAWEFLLGAALAGDPTASAPAAHAASPPAPAGRPRPWHELGGLAGLALILGTVRFLDPHRAASSLWLLLPARAWEFLLGAALAVGSPASAPAARAASPPAPAGRPWPWHELGGLAGLALILGTVRFLDPQRAASSLWLLLPTLGTVLVLACARPGTLAGRLLGHRVPVGLGLVSYSAYLWHQPLLAFLRVRSLDGLSRPMAWLAIGLTLGLAGLSWRYVERPCRYPRHPDRRRTAWLALLGSLGLVAAGAGLRRTLPPPVAPAPPRPVTALAAPPGSAEVPPTRGLMLLGDSHAGHLAFGLKHALGASRVVERWAPACLPLAGVEVTFQGQRGHCRPLIGEALDEFARRRDLSLLVLASMGPASLDNTVFQSPGRPRLAGQRITLAGAPAVTDPWLIYAIGLRRTLARLRRHPGQRTLLVLDVPELGIDSAHCLYPPRVVTVLGTRFGVGAPTYANCRIPRAAFEQRTGRFRRLVRRILGDFPEVALFDPTPLMCDARWCYGARDGQALYHDQDHLSDAGSLYVATRLAPTVARLMEPTRAAGPPDSRKGQDPGS